MSMSINVNEISKLSYPAVFHKEDEGYWVEFPDLKGCLTEGESFDDALFMASDALGEWINAQRDIQVEQINDPTDLEVIKEKYPNEIVSMIEYDDIRWKKEHKLV